MSWIKQKMGTAGGITGTVIVGISVLVGFFIKWLLTDMGILETSGNIGEDFVQYLLFGGFFMLLGLILSRNAFQQGFNTAKHGYGYK